MDTPALASRSPACRFTARSGKEARCAQARSELLGLLDAPESLARLASQVVEAHGATPSLQPGRLARPGRRLLRLGPSFVIARAFRLEPRP